MADKAKYAAIGVVLALGAPMGWLLGRIGLHVSAGTLLAELSSNRPLYLYLLVGPLVAFTAFGLALGALSDRVVQANRRLAELSLTDALTSLRNRRYFEERLAAECARAAREHAPLTLVMMDLDHFKAVNDKWGHAVGDLVLRHAASTIVNNIRAGDVACRVGGEEFMVVCPGTTSSEAFEVAERVREALRARAVTTDKGAVPVTASFGVAEFGVGETPSDVCRRVDKALYSAKAHGRNRTNSPLPEASKVISFRKGRS
jgi:diguanylate cyclase (GGDEF)-like protein